MARLARWVLPVPVGSTTTPRPPASHQALSPSTWCGNASLATWSRHGRRLVRPRRVLVRPLLLPQMHRRSSGTRSPGRGTAGSGSRTSPRGELLAECVVLARTLHDQRARVEDQPQRPACPTRRSARWVDSPTALIGPALRRSTIGTRKSATKPPRPSATPTTTRTEMGYCTLPGTATRGSKLSFGSTRGGVRAGRDGDGSCRQRRRGRSSPAGSLSISMIGLAPISRLMATS